MIASSAFASEVPFLTDGHVALNSDQVGADEGIAPGCVDQAQPLQRHPIEITGLGGSAQDARLLSCQLGPLRPFRLP